MNFDQFKEIFPKLRKIELPGLESQLKMAPSMRQKALDSMKDKMKTARKSAVLVLCYPDENYQTRFALILRKTYKGVHSNQVGLPGGQVEEEDVDFTATALRETYEEIGVPKENVVATCALTETYIPPSNFYVQPFIGYTATTPSFILQESEVETLLQVTLQDLLDDASVIEKRLTTSYAVDIIAPAFKLNDYVVWGATAMMLSEVKDLIKSVI